MTPIVLSTSWLAMPMAPDDLLHRVRELEPYGLEIGPTFPEPLLAAVKGDLTRGRPPVISLVPYGPQPRGRPPRGPVPRVFSPDKGEHRVAMERVRASLAWAADLGSTYLSLGPCGLDSMPAMEAWLHGPEGEQGELLPLAMEAREREVEAWVEHSLSAMDRLGRVCDEVGLTLALTPAAWPDRFPLAAEVRLILKELHGAPIVLCRDLLAERIQAQLGVGEAEAGEAPLVRLVDPELVPESRRQGVKGVTEGLGRLPAEAIVVLAMSPGTEDGRIRDLMVEMGERV